MDESKGTILVVDDNEAGRYVTSGILRRAGYAVREAATGGEALQIAVELPDLVVLDVNLPDMGGLEVCARIKGFPVTGGIPVLHLSATSVDWKSKVVGLDSGADAYLVNPVEPEELVAVVMALLRMKRAEAQARAAIAERDRTIKELEEALREIKDLSSLLPMCSHCKKIRDRNGDWQQFDVYLHRNTDTRVSHGLCEECVKKHYPEYSGAMREDDADDDGGDAGGRGK